VRELILDRHRAMGLLRPNASAEIWSYGTLRDRKRPAIEELVRRGEIVPVDVEGMRAHATHELLQALDDPTEEPTVRFLAPLDQLMWDRKMVQHVFGFEYIWEIYTPEAKRRWGYYVLPVLYGNELVARIEFWARDGTLEIRRWHEERDLPTQFWTALGHALRSMLQYSSSRRVVASADLSPRLRELIAGEP
jgi:uncharacterized protein